MVAPTSIQPTPTHAFTGRDVPWLLAAQAAHRGNHPFLVWEPFEGDGATWSYQQFADDVTRVATGLAAHGVQHGDSVVIHLGNCPEFLLAWFACSHLGAVAVTTNTRSTANELGYFIEHCGAQVAITQPALVPAIVASGAALRLLVCTATDVGSPANPASTTGVATVTFDALRCAPTGTHSPRCGPTRSRPTACNTRRAPRRARRVWSGRMPMRCGEQRPGPDCCT